jgi:methyl coenzyme M reductase subunit C-like uncharacterized protein (methanogenesis marker protein 7)
MASITHDQLTLPNRNVVQRRELQCCRVQYGFIVLEEQIAEQHVPLAIRENDAVATTERTTADVIMYVVDTPAGETDIAGQVFAFVTRHREPYAATDMTNGVRHESAPRRTRTSDPRDVNAVLLPLS